MYKPLLSYIKENLKNKKHIYLYCGKPATENTIKHTKFLFQMFGAIKLLNELTINNLNLTSDDVIVFPGGQNAYYGKEIGKENEKKIKKFVKNGGLIIGICAGAYYLSKKIDWHSETFQEKSGATLKIFNGVSEGPLLNLPFKKENDDGSCSVELSWLDNQDSWWCYYHGGAWFNLKNKHNCKIMSLYKHNNKPAIIEGSYYKGKYLLSGVHFEWR